MKIEIRTPQSGKTTEHVAWLKEETDEDRLLLVQTQTMASNIMAMNSLNSRQVMSWSVRGDLHRRLQGRRPVIRIEEGQGLVEMLIRQHLDSPVEVLQLCSDHVEIGT